VDEVYSHSRLASFESCPRKFHYRYVLRLAPEAEGIEGFVGKRVHEVLERLYLATRRGRVPALERVVRRFHELWEAGFDPARIRIVREQAADWYRAWGERCLVNYYRGHYPFDRDETLGLEQEIAFSLDRAGAYRLRGVVDRIARARDGTLEIHDYKTSQRTPSQEELDRDRQLALYQMGVAPRFGKGPVALVWHYLGSGQARRSTRTPAQLDELRSRTIGLIDRIRAETAFEARPGPLCRWCEYSDRCPAGPRAVAGAADSAPGRAAPVPPAPAPRPVQLPLW
jgi:putative RecB family exonuclease